MLLTKYQLLTDRQASVLLFIDQYHREHKIMPVMQDIANHYSITVKAAYDHVLILQDKGYVTLIPRIARGLKITRQGARACLELRPKKKYTIQKSKSESKETENNTNV